MTDGAPTTSLEVRERLVEALKLDLVGSWAAHAFANERLHKAIGYRAMCELFEVARFGARSHRYADVVSTSM